MKESEDNEVAFFGKITAGVTHEIKNVLAIIKEASGLMEDIMSISPEAVISNQDKIQISLTRIQDQVRRGIELTGRLNKFAHSSYESLAVIDLYEIIGQLVALSVRFAGYKKVVLKVHPPDQSISIRTRPVQLQRILFECIEYCLNLMHSGGQINIYPKKSNENLEIYFLCQGDFPDKTAEDDDIAISRKWPVLQEITASVEGTVKPVESGCGVLLILPPRIES
jgi:signal transduction histidine kinase